MTEKEKEKRAREIQAKTVAICEVLGDTSLFDVAMILGAVFAYIISSPEIEEWKARTFADMIEDRFIQAIDFEYNSKEEQPCSTK